MHPKLHWIFKYLHILNGYFHWIIAKDSPVCPLKERLKLSMQQLLKKNKPNQTKQKPNIQRLQYCYIYYLSDLLFICHYADYASPQHFQTFWVFRNPSSFYQLFPNTKPVTLGKFRKTGESPKITYTLCTLCTNSLYSISHSSSQ